MKTIQAIYFIGENEIKSNLPTTQEIKIKDVTESTIEELNSNSKYTKLEDEYMTLYVTFVNDTYRNPIAILNKGYSIDELENEEFIDIECHIYEGLIERYIKNYR